MYEPNLIKGLAIGTAVILVASGSAANAAEREPEDSSSAVREASFFVSDENVLEPVSQTQRSSSIESPGDDLPAAGFIVTFGVDPVGTIVSKRINQYAPEPEANEEGRDELSTFAADDSGDVELEWWDPSEGEMLWTITRDGDVVDTVHGDHYVDRRPDVNVATTYRVEGSRTVDVDGTTAVEPYVTVITVPALDADPVGQKLGAAAMSAEANSDVMLTAAGAWTLAHQLNTFIPSQYAETPFNLQPCLEAWGGTSVGYYGGDNRGFAQPWDSTPSVRTGLSIYTYFDVLGHQTGGLSTIRTSGTTLYLSNGSILVQKDADLSGVYNYSGAGDQYGNIAGWRHSVSDPLCSVAPTIDYELHFGSVYNGAVRLYGSHDQAPSYEWRVRSTGNWYNMYQFTNKGLQYLFPGFPQAHVDINGGVNPG